MIELDLNMIMQLLQAQQALEETEEALEEIREAGKDTSWIALNTEVVVFEDERLSSVLVLPPAARKHRVIQIEGELVYVDNVDQIPFHISTQAVIMETAKGERITRRFVRPDSELGKSLMLQARFLAQIEQAKTACQAFIDEPKARTANAVIEALTAALDLVK